MHTIDAARAIAGIWPSIAFFITENRRAIAELADAITTD